MADEDIFRVLEVGVTIRVIDELGADPAAASRVISNYFAQQREAYGGIRHMVKRGYRKYSPAMKARIKREFDGTNRDRLLARYNISRSQFYRIIK